MAKIKEEDLRLNIIINSDGKTKLSQLEKQTKMNTMSLSELQKHLKLTNTALSKAVPGTQNWKNLQAEVTRTRQRLAELKDGGASVSNTLNKFFSGIGGKFAIGTLAVQGFNAVLGLGRKAIEDMKTQTQAFGDQWTIAMSGITAGWQQLIANLSTGKNVLKGSVADAIKAGREAAALRDELFERNNSLAIEEQKAATFIAQQNAIAMDSSKSAQERMAALDLVMAKEEELAIYRKDIAEQELTAAKLLVYQRTRLEDNVLKIVVDEYERNRDVILQANNYNELLAQRSSLQQSIQKYTFIDSANSDSALSRMKKQLSEYDSQINSTSQNVVTMAGYVRQYNLGNDELIKSYVDGVKKVEEADTALESARQGQARRRGALNNQISSEAKAAAEKEYADELRIITTANNAEMLEFKRNFVEKTITEQEYNQRSKQQEIKLLLEKIELNKKYGKDTLDLENELQSKKIEGELENQRLMEQLQKDAAAFVSSLETDKTKIAIAAEQKRYQEDLAAFEKSRSALEDQAKVKEQIEAKHRQNMLKIDNDSVQEALRMQSEAHRTEIENIRNTHMAGIITMQQGSFAQAKAVRAMQAEIAASELSYLENYLQQLKILEEKQKSPDADPAELEKIRAEIAQAISEILRVKEELNGGTQADAFSGTGRGSLFGISQAQWQQLFDNLKNGKLGAEDLGAAITAAGEMANEAMQLTSLAIEKTNAKEQQELRAYQKDNDEKKKKLEDRLNAGLITQTQYDRSISQLQEEADARQEELQARQAERQKRASIAQATIQAAVAVAKTFAEWGWPAGIAPAAIMAALGAAQVALISATPTGYAQGGEVARAQDGRKFNAHLSPSKRGFISTPTILVGEEGGEYVIPSDGLKNPSLAPFIGSIEAARRAGTLRNINFAAISPAAASVPAMASGGSTSPFQFQPADYSDILEEMRNLGSKIENIRAIVPMLGEGGIVQALDNYNKIKKRSSL